MPLSCWNFERRACACSRVGPRSPSSVHRGTQRIGAQARCATRPRCPCRPARRHSQQPARRSGPAPRNRCSGHCCRAMDRRSVRAAASRRNSDRAGSWRPSHRAIAGPRSGDRSTPSILTTREATRSLFRTSTCVAMKPGAASAGASAPSAGSTRTSTMSDVSAVYCFGSSNVAAMPAAETSRKTARMSHLRAQMMRRYCLSVMGSRL